MDEFNHGLNCECLQCKELPFGAGLDNQPQYVEEYSTDELYRQESQFTSTDMPIFTHYDPSNLFPNLTYSQTSFPQYYGDTTTYQPAPLQNYTPLVQQTPELSANLPRVLEELDQPSTSTGYTGRHEDSSPRRRTKVCDHCKKTFTHTGDFTKHLRKHTKEKPYDCKQCGRSFSHTSNLHRHVRSHQGDRPFKCEVCFKEFNRKDKLDNHKKSKTCRNKRHEGK